MNQTGVRSTGCSLQALTNRDSGADMRPSNLALSGPALCHRPKGFIGAFTVWRGVQTLDTCPSDWGAPKEITSFPWGIGLSFIRRICGGVDMAANQVVLYFDKQEDALLFTLAAISVMSADGPVHGSNAVVKVAEEICKASRITTEGVLNNSQLI